MECSVTTSPDSKSGVSLVEESLYYRFQICIGRRARRVSGDGRLTLDTSMSDLQVVQVVGRDFFAGIWNGLFFEIDTSLASLC
jgi:hypothetical protein